MPGEKIRRQLRRCTVCGTVGHNKSTCKQPAKNLPPLTKPAAGPAHFFVHHVTTAAVASPHILNLKKNTIDVWHEVEAVTPADNSTLSLYQRYHTAPVVLDHGIVEPPQPVPLARQTNTLALPTKKMPARPVVKKESRPPLQLKKRAVSLARRTAGVIREAGKMIPVKAIAVIVGGIALISAIPGPALGYYQNVETQKTTATTDSLSAFQALAESGTALEQADVATAQTKTAEALDNFNAALNAIQNNTLLETIGTALPVVGGELTSREKMVVAGQEITLGNTYILDGIAAIKNTSNTPSDSASVLTNYVAEALPHYHRASDNLAGINASDLPTEYQSSFQTFRGIFTTALGDLDNFGQLSSAFQEIIGGNGLRRYLIVFQNPDELRPTGGFLGSFAVLEVENGKIVSLTVPPGGSYDLQGQLDENVIPPTPLLLVNKRWEFQDANWFPDFTASAQKISWFYEHSRQQTVDGVIAVNATVLQRLLAITGPITDAGRGLTIDAANALPTIQQIVETGPEKKANKPKQIIADLTTDLLDRIKQLSSDQVISLGLSLDDALQQKEIQAYFNDAAVEKTVDSFGWAGTIKPTSPNQDYLLVVDTNIAGQKSDADINETISHQAQIQSDNSIVDTVIIKRTHTGEGSDLYNQTNIDYLRIYVPAGSQFISGSGFSWPDDSAFKTPDSSSTPDAFLVGIEQEVGVDEQTGTRITDEFGKTAFGNWVITEPSSTSEVVFTYRLPFSAVPTTQTGALNSLLAPLEQPLFNYQLMVQKQSGSRSLFDSQIMTPAPWQSVWTSSNDMESATNGIVIPPTESSPPTKSGVYCLNNNHSIF